MITKINPTIPVVNKNGIPEKQLNDFFIEVVNESLLVGDGSPEGVVVAPKGSRYMDEGVTGIPGAILYIKKLADIGGDRKLGWILV